MANDKGPQGREDAGAKRRLARCGSLTACPECGNCLVCRPHSHAAGRSA